MYDAESTVKHTELTKDSWPASEKRLDAAFNNGQGGIMNVRASLKAPASSCACALGPLAEDEVKDID